MAKLVQQSTTADPLIFVLTASSDHISGLTGKAGSVVVSISKNGAAGVTPSGAISEIDATNLPGQYAIAGNATDTNTLGSIWVHAKDAASDPSDIEAAQIVPWNPRAANLPANVTQINASALAAQALAQSTQSICWGTCSGGTTSTAVVSTLNNPATLTTTGQLIGRTIIFLGGTSSPGLQAQASVIIASATGATPTLTFTAITTAPANGDVFVIL